MTSCVIEPPAPTPRDTACTCEPQCEWPEFIGNGYCRCGIWKHHCPECGGVTQVG